MSTVVRCPNCGGPAYLVYDQVRCQACEVVANHPASQSPSADSSTAGFDPYYTWLGIPPAEQPPHHYRLLGLRSFESSPQVIANAANRQTAHLRTFFTGSCLELAQRLTQEVSAARDCLLNAARKQQYDATLRGSVPAQMQSASAPVPVALASQHTTQTTRPTHTYSPRRRSGNNMALPIAVFGGVSGIAIAIAILATLKDNRPVSHQATPSQHQAPTEIQTGFPLEPKLERDPAAEASEHSPQSVDVQSEPDELNVVVTRPAAPSTPMIEQPEPPATSNESVGEVDRVTHQVTLDLTRRDMYLLLNQSDESPTESTIQVLGLGNVSETHSLNPDDGILAKGKPVEILFPNVPRVRVLVALDNRLAPTGAARVKISPQVDLNRKVPAAFTEKMVKKLHEDAVEAGENLSRQLAAAAKEKKDLEDWIQAPGLKSLDARNQAVRRTMQLGNIVGQLQKQLPIAETNLDNVAQLRQFGEALHNVATVQIRVSSEPE